MQVERTTYALIVRGEGLGYTYAENIFNQPMHFETLEEARKEKKAYLMLNTGERVWVLKETREIILDEADEEYKMYQEFKEEELLEEGGIVNG